MSTRAELTESPSGSFGRSIQCPRVELPDGTVVKLDTRFSGDEDQLSGVPCSLIVGTGGTISGVSVLSRALSLSWFSTDDATETASAVVTPAASMVALIRSVLSLRMTEVAEVLGVDRQSVYAWLRDDSSPASHNLSRLQEVFAIADWWSEAAQGRPVGNAIRQSFAGDATIIDLLGESDIPAEKIKARLRNLNGVLSPSAKRSRRTSALDVARRYGFDESPESVQSNRLDLETAKRPTPEH